MNQKFPNEVITGYCEITDKNSFLMLMFLKLVSKDNYIIYASRAPIFFNKKKNLLRRGDKLCHVFPKKKLEIFYKLKKKHQ